MPEKANKYGCYTPSKECHSKYLNPNVVDIVLYYQRTNTHTLDSAVIVLSSPNDVNLSHIPYHTTPHEVNAVMLVCFSAPANSTVYLHLDSAEVAVALLQTSFFQEEHQSSQTSQIC